MTDPAMTEAPPLRCRICGNDEGNTPYRVREMQYGTRENFDYFQCGQCGCLQILSIPTDLARHYPEDYFSFRQFDRLAGNRVRRFIDRHRIQHSMGKRDLVGWAANRLGRPLDYLGWVQRAGLGLDARVLDVGCGTGKVLLCMKLGGFASCTGVDPFIKETLRYPNGVTIFKTNLDAFSASAGPFDLIMFHLSLAHMSDPLKGLRVAESLLAPGGCILAAVPVADSQAWEDYRENWFNLDAPRRIHLLTRPSMSRLADKVGLRIEHMVSVGGVSQFVESERYKRDIPGNAPVRAANFVSRQQLVEFERRTDYLNREGRGDQVMFYLRRRSG